MVLLLDAYSEEKDKEGIKVRLKLNADIAPARVGVFPLMKKDGLAEKAKEVFETLKKRFCLRIRRERKHRKEICESG